MKVQKVTWDLSYLDRLPMTGYTWIVFFKFFKPIPNVRHKKEKLACYVIETTITKTFNEENKMLKMKEIN